MQTITLGKPFIDLKGEWEKNKDYEYLDSVTYKGSLFIANAKFIPAGTEPMTNKAWLIAAKGDNNEEIRNLFSEHTDSLIKDGVHGFPQGKEGQVLTIKDGEFVFEYKYELCEIYSWRHPILKDGFESAQGGLIENAEECYPDAWAYLQTDEGKELCKTEEEWQALTNATWATLDDGTEIGFDGIGGAPFYVQDLDAGTLRLPDLRGMYAEAAGFDELDVGGVHGDSEREKEGSLPHMASYTDAGKGIFKCGDINAGTNPRYISTAVNGPAHERVGYRTSLVAPVANKNQPRAWGANACVYLGTPNTNS